MLISYPFCAGRQRHQFTRNILLGGIIKCLNTAAVFGNWFDCSMIWLKIQDLRGVFFDGECGALRKWVGVGGDA